MPKLKTHSGAKKRFRFTASGKVKYKKIGAQHLLAKKSSKRMLHLRKAGILSKSNTATLKRMMPYSG